MAQATESFLVPATLECWKNYQPFPCRSSCCYASVLCWTRNCKSVYCLASASTCFIAFLAVLSVPRATDTGGWHSDAGMASTQMPAITHEQQKYLQGRGNERTGKGKQIFSTECQNKHPHFRDNCFHAGCVWPEVQQKEGRTWHQAPCFVSCWSATNEKLEILSRWDFASPG